MIDIRTLQTFDPTDLTRIMPGYTSTEKYEVRRRQSPDDSQITFVLSRISLTQPYIKTWNYDDEDTVGMYTRYVSEGTSLGAYDGDLLVGIAITETRQWNQTMWIWEFGVVETHRRQDIGYRMMDELASRATRQGLRVMAAETQNTNVPAIRFYRKAGFAFDAVDLSLYSNEDITEGEVAIFMKRQLDTR